MSTRPVIAPLPEAIDGQPWSVQNQGNPRVDLHARQMFVPLSESPEDHFVRLHEMAHTKWTPRSKDPMKEAAKIGVSWEIIQACEDMRMHELLFRNGFGPQLVGTNDEKELTFRLRKTLLQPDPLPMLAMLAVCTTNTGDFMRMLNVLGKLDVHDPSVTPSEAARGAFYSKKVNEIAVDTCAIMRSTATDPKKIKFKGTLEAAKFLHDAIKSASRDDPPPDGDSGGGTEAGDASPEQNQEEKIKEALRERIRERYKGSTEDQWGEAKHAQIPLSVPVKKALAARRNKATDCGSVPRYMHRLAIDGQVFSRKRKSPGGTILIDASGSMRLAPSDIDALLEHAPCATVAMYSGHRVDGTITLIARNSHRADGNAIERAKHQAGGNNIIDGPALEWLSKQQEPRIWVSDAQVSGYNHAFSLKLFVKAMAIAKQGRITRLGNVERAIIEFEKIAKGKQAKGDALPTSPNGA